VGQSTAKRCRDAGRGCRPRGPESGVLTLRPEARAHGVGKYRSVVTMQVARSQPVAEHQMRWWPVFLLLALAATVLVSANLDLLPVSAVIFVAALVPCRRLA
jgi:hypothetical protein